MHDTFIFLGPTLSHIEAKKIASATYLPPVRCGDIVKLLRLRPKRIVIIDGYFEDTAAVWHKEILTAIQLGIEVIGASSMGALRAAELQSLGMQGLGQIYTDFYHGVLEDDDEVAVLHAGAEQSYRCLSHAMVNIRATLDNALTQNIITQNDVQLVITESKRLYYRERLLQVAIENALPVDRACKLHDWLHDNNYVDLKRCDAIAALTYCADNAIDEIEKENAAQTSLTATLIHEANCSPLPFYFDSLSVQERLTQLMRLLPDYPLLKIAARLFAVKERLMLNHEINDDAEHNVKIESTIDFFLLLQDNFIPKKALQAYHSKRYALFKLMATMWVDIDRKSDLLRVVIDESTFLSAFECYRLQHNLLTEDDVLLWMEQRQLDEDGMMALFGFYARLYYIVVKYRIDFFDVGDIYPENYLFAVLNHTSYLADVKTLLSNKTARLNAINHFNKQLKTHKHSLVNYDFYNHEEWQLFNTYYNETKEEFAYASG